MSWNCLHHCAINKLLEILFNFNYVSNLQLKRSQTQYNHQQHLLHSIQCSKAEKVTNKFSSFKSQPFISLETWTMYTNMILLKNKALHPLNIHFKKSNIHNNILHRLLDDADRPAKSYGCLFHVSNEHFQSLVHFSLK